MTHEEKEALCKKLEIAPAIIRQYLGKIAFRRQQQLEQRGNFDEKFPEDPYTAFLVSGNQYFDKEILIARKQELLGFKPYAVLRGGEGKVFFRKVLDRNYIIGADVASGRTINSTDTDYNAAVCLDLETGEEVGSLHVRSRPEEFAYDLAELGEYFNFAPVYVERTGDGGTTILTLDGECRYPAVGKYREWIRREKKEIELEGFPTTPKTRPIALNFLNRMVSAHPEYIWDEQFLNEALVFVRDERGIPAAAPGSHDDRVSCRWVAHMMRMVVLGFFDPINSKSEGYKASNRITEEELAMVG
jgi:hypothetical protein